MTISAAFPPPGQARYQVRFDVGAAGLARIGAADVVVWVDALGGAAAGVDTAALSPDAAILAADLRNRTATARWILDHQVAIGRRASVSIVTASGDGPFGSADVLAAGAVVDALAALGIDFSSPEAAVACAAYTGLSGAVAHLVTASVAGQDLIAAGSSSPDELRSRAAVDADDHPVVLRAPSA